MFRFILTFMAAMLCLTVTAQTELNMGNQFGNENIDEIPEWTQEGFSLTPAMGNNPKEKVPCYKSKNKEVRCYASNTLLIKAPEGVKMTEVTFTLSKQGVEEQAVITASTGEINPQEVGSNKVNWCGNASEITFTVGETNSLHPEGVADGSGQFDFITITIQTESKQTGIIEISSEQFLPNSHEYYDLSGNRVLNPSTGFFICRQGEKISKIYLR